MKHRKPPDSIVEIVHGLPGSGKSLGGVQSIAYWIKRQRRPVYTNLPIRWQVFKKYLRVTGQNPRIAGYLRELRQEHIERFVPLAVKYREYKRNHREKQFEAECGPLIEEGPEANWLPWGSMMLIDEAHQWFPETTKGKLAENPSLIKYVTMHRHWWHYVRLLSQHPMQISLSFRRQCNQYVEVRDLSRTPLWPGCKIPGVRDLPMPIKVLEYATFPGFVAVNGDSKSTEPTKVKRSFPFLTGGVWFRLYTSHEQGGSQRQMWNKLAQVRASVEGPEGPRLPWDQRLVAWAYGFLGLDRSGLFGEGANNVFDLVDDSHSGGAAVSAVADHDPSLDRVPHLAAAQASGGVDELAWS